MCDCLYGWGGTKCDEVTCVNGGASFCDDGNPCTTDSCSETDGCVHVANSEPCDDDNVCTVIDQCSDGACLGALPTLDCDDGIPCTIDTCDITVGCVSVIEPGTCLIDGICRNEGDSQTPTGNGACAVCDPDQSDTAWSEAGNTKPCAAGYCLGLSHVATAYCTAGQVCEAPEPVDCNTGNLCKNHSCSSVSGCGESNKGTGTACTDGDACTEGDACQTGTCVPGTPLDCNDGIACSADSCDSAEGCIHTDIEGFCFDGNDCTDDLCSQEGLPVVGCLWENNTDSCDDGSVCSTTSICAGGTCEGKTFIDCNDGIACTADSCDPSSGCVYTPDDSACDTNQLCVTDVCLVGVGCGQFDTAPCCGNGILEPGEECDDSNDSDGDGCSSTCADQWFCPGDCWSGGLDSEQTLLSFSPQDYGFYGHTVSISGDTLVVGASNENWPPWASFGR